MIPEESEYAESSKYEDTFKSPLVVQKGDRMQSQAMISKPQEKNKGK